MKKPRIYKAIILRDYSEAQYATWVKEGIKTIETRMKYLKYSGDIVICCGNKSVTNYAGLALCVVHFGKGRPMKKKDASKACIGKVKGRVAYDLTNFRKLSRLFRFTPQRVAGAWQSIFDIRLPKDVIVYK